jgi:hypothetical protein
MAGLTPFQFSSKLLQNQSTSGLLGINIGGTAGGLIQSTFAWYEMWINPEKVDISTTYQQKKQHTAGSIVTYHYRADTPTMSVSGQCGWIMTRSQLENANVADQFVAGLGYQHQPKSTDPNKKKFWTQGKDFFKFKGQTFPGQRRAEKLASDNTNNSPRQFLSRLKGIADEPMYFIDSQGIEHYNIKFIKIFTKQFPTGVICEGYFTKFSIPESADDVQTITYNFDFIIENQVPVTYLDTKLSMYGTRGQGSAIGSVLTGRT